MMMQLRFLWVLASCIGFTTFALQINIISSNRRQLPRRVSKLRSTPPRDQPDILTESMNDRLATLVSEVYSDIEFDANLDEETRKEYETLVSAAFDKTVREMQAMGDDLKGESDEDLKALAKMVETKRKLVEEQAESVDLYGKKVSILTERVKRAAGKVEEEVEIMKGLQQQIQNDPLLRLSNYREQPLSRQVFLVGAFLFFIRGSTDGLTTLLSVGTSGATAGSAVTQIGVSIALLCVYLFL